MIEALRARVDRFADRPGYPFAPHFVEVDGLRMHHLDEGARPAPVLLCFHRQPS